MKTIKLLMIMAVVLLLAAGCAPLTEDEDAGCPTTTVSSDSGEAAAEVPSYSDQSATDTAPPATAAQVSDTQLQMIHFDFDQHTLTAEARTILDGNASYLQANPDVKVVITGNCDERGSDEYNLALGERRAAAARDYLVSMGIDPQRLSVISYGEEKPLDPDHNEAAWAMNRRAEFVPQN